MKTIKIHYSLFSALSVGKDVKDYDDVWISFFVGKRKRKFFSPCLINKKCFDLDFDFYKSIGKFVDKENKLQEFHKIKSDFDGGAEYGIIEAVKDMPDVYFNKDIIKRKDFEKFIISYFNFKNIKFCWAKR